MKPLQLIFLIATSTLARADIVVNDFMNFKGFIDFSFMIPIKIELESIVEDTVTICFKSEEGSIYSIRHHKELSSGTWSVEGTSALLNEIELPVVDNDQYIFTATSSQTKIEITFSEGLPDSAFFRGYIYISQN